jgi:hypothetical protein
VRAKTTCLIIPSTVRQLGMVEALLTREFTIKCVWGSLGFEQSSYQGCIDE